MIVNTLRWSLEILSSKATTAMAEAWLRVMAALARELDVSGPTLEESGWVDVSSTCICSKALSESKEPKAGFSDTKTTRGFRKACSGR